MLSTASNTTHSIPWKVWVEDMMIHNTIEVLL